MRSPHLRRPPLPTATILAVLAGFLWLAAVVARGTGRLAVPTWIVVCGPWLLVVALFVLYVAGALLLTAYFAFAASWAEWRERRWRRRESRRIKEFFDRGLHIVDCRDRVEPPRH